MQLYVGTTDEFYDDAVRHRLSDVLNEQFYDYYGYRATVSELQSWNNSLLAMALQIKHAALRDNTIIVEYELPLSSSRLDCLIFGHDESDAPRGLLVELKQWDKVLSSDVEYCVRTWIGKAERDVLHPSEQALRYARFLTDAHTAYDEGCIALRPCSYLHNMRPGDALALRSDRFAELTAQSPLFVGQDVDQFAEVMNAVVGHGKGDRVLAAAMSGTSRPSRKLLEHTAAVIRGEPRYTLLDDQVVAYETVLAEVRRGHRSKKARSVVVVKGGPGTGKSVIALNLMARLAKLGFNVRHATGSKAFTQTLWSILGSRMKPQFRYFNNFGKVEGGSIDVVLCDESHRIRKTSEHRFMKAADRTGAPQVDELITAARVSVFFVDDHQAVRPEEIGSSHLIREASVRLEARYREVDLHAQFRCAGSGSYLDWLDQLLEIRKTGRVYLPADDPLQFSIANSVEALDREVRERLAEGQAARLVAGFCWPWSDPRPDGTLVDDVVVGRFRRPWNAKPDAGKLAAGVPPAPLWASAPGGVDQVGCIYTAQGFEFDHVGVIFGPDLVVRSATWVAVPGASKDSMTKRAGGKPYVDCVKNAYRVLMTRGLRSCSVAFLDEETRGFVESRLGATHA